MVAGAGFEPTTSGYCCAIFLTRFNSKVLAGRLRNCFLLLLF